MKRAQFEYVLPSIFLSNARSICNKSDELIVVASTVKPDIIAITESWTNDKISDSQIGLCGFQPPFRCDRKSGKGGGGVCCFVKTSIICSDLSAIVPCPPCIEIIWLFLRKHKLIISVLYSPPGLSSAELNEVKNYIVESFDKITNSLPETRLILMGDFNQMLTSDLEICLSASQVVDFPTRGKSILDKIFLDCRVIDQYSHPAPSPCLGNSDHLSLILNPIASSAPSPISLRKVIDYRQSNIDRFANKINSFPWHKWYRSSLSVQEKTDIFYKWIEEALYEIPHAYVEVNNSDKPWMTPVIKHLIKCKYSAYYAKDMPLYMHYKDKVQNEISKAKKVWKERLMENRGGIWKIVKDVKNSRVTKSGVKEIVETKFSNVQDGVEEINNSLCAVFSQAPDWNAMDVSSSVNLSWNLEITVDLVYNELLKINDRKSPGSDGIHGKLIKKCAHVFASPLTHLYCLSKEYGEIPSQWKTANVIPVPKNKSKNLENIRPISLLPVFAKVLEKIVVDSLKEKFIDIYGENQFGFRPNSSTLMLLIALMDYITIKLDEPNIQGACIMSFDLSRAFDRLHHGCLMKTLKSSALPNDFLSWMKSFLSGRFQRVVVEDFFSKSKAVTSGVPQGSRLSPYLFSCQMGSLKSSLTCSKMFKYADDIIVVVPYHDGSQLREDVEYEITNIDKWCRENGLLLNKDKTKVMVVRKNPASGSVISSVQEFPEMNILGVTIRNDLKWDSHTENICKDASRYIYILKELKRLGATKQELVKVFNATIRSKLEYNSPVFVGLSNKNSEMIEKIRKRCHRIICNFECTCDILPSLCSRRESLSLKTFKRMLCPSHLLFDLTPFFLPSMKRLSLPLTRTKRRSNSFIPYCSSMFNLQCS